MIQANPAGTRSAKRSTAWRFASLAAATALLGGALIPSLGVSAAAADDLDDQANSLQQEANNVASSLEFVDSGIAKTASDLTLYNGRLPGARQAVQDAQNQVAAANDQVNSLANRVSLAEQNKENIAAQIDADKSKLADSKHLIGVIASQTYKHGGVPSNLTLLMGKNPTEAANNVAMANQALAGQKSLVSQLSEKNAVDANSAQRLAAVESEIKDLKAQADAALATKQKAQDDAAAKKADLDKLVGDTQKLSDELNAKRPEIEAKLADVKQQQDNVASQIAERQRKEREEWEAQQRAAAAAAGNNNYQPPAPGPVTSSAWGLASPFPGIPIISGFGMRQVPPGTLDPYGTGYYMHSGVDFAATCGTPVHAAAAGTVVGAGWFNNGGGNGVQISHGVVNGNALITMYYHNTSVLVSQGQHVEQGQLIAYSGTTGNSNGCHAHFETWVNGQAVDPQGLL